MKKFSHSIPMICDNKELTVRLTGTFYPFHAGHIEKSGGQIEPDEPAYFDIESIYIEEYQKEIYPNEAAIIFEREEVRLMEYFEEQMLNALAEYHENAVYF